MRKFDFWKTDWFLGVAVVIVVILSSHLSDLVPSLERKAYGLGAPQGKPDKALPDYVRKNNLANLAKSGEDALVGEASAVPAPTAVDIEP